MKVINLKNGLCDTPEYNSFKFPGGEIHIKLKDTDDLYDSPKIQIVSNIQNSDQLILLLLTIDTIRKDMYKGYLEVFIPYFPYQQADRNFSIGECFSLKTITNILNTLDVDSYLIYDAHSDVTPALLKNSKVIDNSEYIKYVIEDIRSDDLTLLSPDAGAYKKIGKLASKIEFKGDVAAANKYRSISSGDIESIELSKSDFNGSDILIVDDICMGGRTFIELAKKLKERNVGKLYLAVSHGIFNNGFSELEKYFDKLYTTNSRKDNYTYNSGECYEQGIKPKFLKVYNL